MLEFMAGRQWASEILAAESLSAAEARRMLDECRSFYEDAARDALFRQGALDLLSKAGLLD